MFVSRKLVVKFVSYVLLIFAIKIKGLDSGGNGQNIAQAGISMDRDIFARLKRGEKGLILTQHIRSLNIYAPFKC